MIRQANEKSLEQCILTEFLDQLNKCLDAWNPKRAIELLQELVGEYSTDQGKVLPKKSAASLIA